MSVVIKRVYETATPSDGFRILVDRLWPRGISKEEVGLDLWLKDIAPSTQLRKWFNHKPENFKEFSKLYQSELRQNPAFKELVDLISKHKQTTLLYAAKDPRINHAVVLKRFLENN